MQDASVQLHAGDNSVALVHAGVLDSPEGADGDEERALRPTAVEHERAATEHVQEYHGHHGGDDGRGVVDDLGFGILVRCAPQDMDGPNSSSSSRLTA